MRTNHARTLAHARSCLAILADTASSIAASSAYEHILIQLDWLHHDTCPAITPIDLPIDRHVVLASAVSALRELEQYGVDPLRLELVLAALQDAAMQDAC